jgi:hypothetical protein
MRREPWRGERARKSQHRPTLPRLRSFTLPGMASTKNAPKKAATPSTTKPAKAKLGKAKLSKPGKRGITAAQRTALLALDPSFDAPIDRNIAETQQEARELQAVLAKLGKDIYAKSNLDKATGASLEARRAVLETAESAWTDHRNSALSKSLREVRAEAEELKRDVIAALRHFQETDSVVQTRVDAIIPGTDLPDLINDLKKLATLLDESGARLARADLPRHPADKARGYAESLSRGSADRAVDTQGTELMSLRNRAFWHLREAMDAVRSAGRYVYRKQPKILVAFRASSSRARARAGTARSVDKPSPTLANGAAKEP